MAVPRLSKSDVETLTRDYDADPVAALQRALSIVCRADDVPWDELVRGLGLDADTTERLVSGDLRATDEMLRDLVELRTVRTMPERR